MRVRWIWFAALGGVAAVALAAKAQTTITYGQTTVTTDTIVKNGRTYVPIADAAKAFGVQVRKTDSGFEFFQEGGANQLNGLTGKVGQTLNCGYATVKLVKIEHTAHYKQVFADGVVDASGPSADVVVATMHVKNATHETQWFNPIGDQNIALVDDQDHSYQPFTGMAADMRDRGAKLLPGSAYDFALVFDIPKSAKLTQLVYGADFMNPHLGKIKDFRIDLD